MDISHVMHAWWCTVETVISITVSTWCTYVVAGAQFGEARLDLDAPGLLERAERRRAGRDERRVTDVGQARQDVGERRAVARLIAPARCPPNQPPSPLLRSR